MSVQFSSSETREVQFGDALDVEHGNASLVRMTVTTTTMTAAVERPTAVKTKYSTFFFGTRLIVPYLTIYVSSTNSSRAVTAGKRVDLV